MLVIRKAFSCRKTVGKAPKRQQQILPDSKLKPALRAEDLKGLETAPLNSYKINQNKDLFANNHLAVSFFEGVK
jgi:hypothetical protein